MHAVKVVAALLVGLGARVVTASPILTQRQARAVCCNELAHRFPEQTIGNSSAAYEEEINAFWSSNSVRSPSCVFAPTLSSQVAEAVGIFVENECEFAIRGGGHTALAGAASIDDGILISFSGMRNITMHLEEDPPFVSVGPGAVWGEVYQAAEEFSVAPVVGRFFPVGTGLALGAGFSFLGNENGFASDNVMAYEVAIANGSLIMASQENAPDLHRALKGGGNNFGVVTRYDLYLREGGLVVGGQIQAPENQTEQWQDQAYHYATVQAVEDFRTHALPIHFYVGEGDVVTYQTQLYYNQHNSSELPPIMSGWVNDIETSRDTVRQSNYSDLALELTEGFENGLFQEHLTYTIEANRDEYRWVWATFLEWARTVGDFDGFNLLHSHHIVTPRMVEAGIERGGNSMGLEGTERSLTVLYFGITMNNRHEEVVQGFHEVFGRLVEHSRSTGVLQDFIVMNYGGEGQQVLESYGAESNQRMQAVRAAYDPDAVFDRLVPGGFKL